MQKENFVFVIPKITGGGAERVVSLVASELAVLNYNVHIIAEHASSQEYPLDSGVKVHYIESEYIQKRTIRQKIHKFLLVRGTIRKVTKNGTTIVIPFLPGCVIHTYYAAHGLPVVYVATIRNNPRFIDERFKKKNDQCICKANLLWTQNGDQQKYYAELGQKRSFILRNPVNPIALENEHVYGKKLRNFVAVGRLEKQKNFELLIHAFSEVVKQYNEATLRIFGEGSLYEKLSEIICESGLENNVTLCGRVTDVLSELQRADVFVMSSDYEGMPNALMESMAIGLPCIATDCPSGPAELLAEGRGWVTECENVEKLSLQMLDVISNPQTAEQAGRKAKEYMRENYSLEKITLELIEHVRERI